MHRLLPLIVLLAACDSLSSIRDCTSETTDCCTSDTQCAEYYGDIFVFCHDPDEDADGQCVECLTDVHCGLAGRCVEDEVLGRYCTP